MLALDGLEEVEVEVKGNLGAVSAVCIARS